MSISPNTRGFSDAGMDYARTMTLYALGANVVKASQRKPESDCRVFVGFSQAVH
jgi:hypothetical protein